MKGLDTPVLLDLLRGRPEALEFIRASKDEELATTVINLFELEAVAAAGTATSRTRRMTAIHRLRRRLTILSIDSNASAAAALLASGPPLRRPASIWLMLGAAEAAGCSEWVSTRRMGLPSIRSRMKVKYYA